MTDNKKLIDINGLEVVYGDILTTLKDNYVKNSDVQESKTVTPATSSQTIEADTGKSYLKQVVVAAIPNQQSKKTETLSVSTTAAQTITIPAGYYTEASTVTLPRQDAVTISSTSITPTTSQQTVTVSAGWNAEADTITVAKIPSKYKDTTGADASTANVLNGKKFVNSSGLQTGSMPNIGKQTISLSTTSRSVAISKGYHDGTGTAIVPPDYYPVNSTNTTATASDILQGKKVVGTDGNTITGNIATVTVTDPSPDLNLGDLFEPAAKLLEIKPSRYNLPIIKALTPGYLGKGPFSADGFKNYIVVNSMDKAVVTLAGTATNGTANIAANLGLSDFTTTTPTDYYVELTTTSGSVTPDYGTNTAGYMGSEYEMEGNITKISTDVPVNGNGSKIYFQVASLATVKNAVNGSGQTTN